MKLKTEEDEIVKYAITFLLSNLDDDIVEDMSEFIGTDDYEEIEQTLHKIIENLS